METQIEFEGFSSLRPLSRHQWISACEFHDLSQQEVLKEVARRASEHSHSIVLLDLDSTLYEVGPRTFQILKEWAQSEGSVRFPKARTAVLEMTTAQLGYSVKDTFSRLELEVEEHEGQNSMDAVKKFWTDRFFTNEYLVHDRPYPGAAHFAQQLLQAGAEIIYLTGRDEPQMGEGTRANLVRDGFPIHVKGTHLLMKAAFHLADLDHKKSAAEYIRKHGTLIASFENEPLNLVALYQIFPDAMHVFVDTVCSEDHAMPCRGLYRICGFE